MNPEQAVQTICDFYGTDPKDIIGSKRKMNSWYVDVRQEIAIFLTQNLKLSWRHAADVMQTDRMSVHYLVNRTKKTNLKPYVEI